MAHQLAKPQIHAYSIALCLILALLFPAQAQNLTSQSKKATKAYLKAEEAFRKSDFETAKKNLNEALKTDSTFIEAWLLLADYAAEKNDVLLGIESLENALAIDTLFFPYASIALARFYNQAMQYESALTLLSNFLKNKNLNPLVVKSATELYQLAVFRDSLVRFPVQFDPMNVGKTINTASDEYINVLRLEGNQLIFTRRSNESSETALIERFYHSKLIDGVWQEAEQFELNWPNEMHLGAMSVRADGLEMYFSACGWDDGFGSCDLYVSYFENGKWTIPYNLGNAINSISWESQPCISADGKELYFSSKRKGGEGGADIWKSEKAENGKWKMPVNLGKTINTSGNEMAPFMHSDGKTLYFSSDGHFGMGNYDLFVVRKNIDGTWGKPVNLGFPVNTPDDEINFVVEASGEKAWISANKADSFGGFDSYTFELDAHFRPDPVSYIKGFVYDKETQKPLQAQLTLADPYTEEVLIATESNADGSFFVALPSKTSYALEIRKQTYLFYQEAIFPTSTSETKPFELHVYLEPIAEGKSVLLRNIHFEFNSAMLSESSNAGIAMLKTFLENNSLLTIELSGHTDNIGDEDFNLKLSENRAKVVKEALVKLGIDPNRIATKGYGSSQPIAPNDSEANRALNRRTDMKICLVLK
jgi:outer membrane protein OmpA-like peptidoglycan-associated protein